MPGQVQAGKLHFIDSLRGVAILMVILSHTAQRIEGKAGITDLVTGFGSMGVQLFFILSAYTLCLSVRNRQSEQHPVRAFYIRRFFRIAPMYYLGILIYGSYAFLEDQFSGGQRFASIYTIPKVMSNVFFVHGFYAPGNNRVVPGGWSIGTEMAFYVLFPLLFYWAGKLAKNKTLLLLAPFVCFGISWLGITVISDAGYFKGTRFLYFNLLNQLPSFILGMAYYFLLHERRHTSLLGGHFLLLFFLAAGSCVALREWGAGVTGYPFLASLSFLLLVEAFRRRSQFNLPVLRRIGQLSYSMYVIHFLFAWYLSAFVANQYLVKWILPEIAVVLCFLVSTALTMMIAMLTEKTIERKGIAWGKILIARLQPKPAITLN